MIFRCVRFLVVVAIAAFVAACVDFNVQCTPNVTDPSGLAGYLGGAGDGGQPVTLSLDKVTVRSGDNTIGQLLTEAYYHSYDKLITDPTKLPAISVENAGSIRTECRDTLST